jgi:hypothetical protein
LKRKRRLILGSLIFALIILAGGIFAALTIIRTSPGAAAQGADIMRRYLGDRIVAQAEMLVFRLEDQVTGLQYTVGLKQVEAPWEIGESEENPAGHSTAAETFWETEAKSSPTNRPRESNALQDSNSTDEYLEKPTTTPTAGITPSLTPTPISSPTPVPWVPSPVTAMGSIEGEGDWSPYIVNQEGEIIAYRTFLQPDPDRDYTIVAVVALDLEKIRLNFVPGFEEPYNPEVERSGAMPEKDKIPGHLIASFNGGFKAQHGSFGAMVDGIEILPPRTGMATVAMFSDGVVRIGEWGADFPEDGEVSAWRQNGPLVIRDGEINPQIYSNSPDDWGYTVDDYSPTLRSGLGISPDGRTLYFIAGTKAIMESIAASMQALGIDNGMQLDINNYWVHFVTYPAHEQELIAEPLLPELMIENLDRYLYPFGRDYFYITAR